MSDVFDPNIAYRTFRADLQTLFKLVITHGKPCDEGDIRAASSILRRWLIEGLLGRMCNEFGVKPTVWVLDNREVIDAIKLDPTILFFLTGGVKFDGKPVMCIYESSAEAGPVPKLPIVDGLAQIECTIAEMLDQKRIFHAGTFFSCADIVQFTANKLGGVHLDFKRNEKFKKLEDASTYMSFGGPIEKMDQPPQGELYLDLEPNATEILSGSHIEIIAAAASLLSIEFDGQPLVEFVEKRSFRNRVKQLIKIRRNPEIKLHDMKEGSKAH